MQDLHPVRNPLVKNIHYSKVLRNETENSYTSALRHSHEF